MIPAKYGQFNLLFQFFKKAHQCHHRGTHRENSEAADQDGRTAKDEANDRNPFGLNQRQQGLQVRRYRFHRAQDRHYRW